MARQPDLEIVNKKKENLQNSELCHSGWPQGKTERKQKRDKYLDLAKELTKVWNMKVAVVPTVIDALSIATKGLVQRLENLRIRGQEENIQTTASWRLVEYWEKSWRFEVTQTLVKNSQMSKIIILYHRNQ